MSEKCKHNSSAVKGMKIVHAQGRVRARNREICLGGPGQLPRKGNPGDSSSGRKQGVGAGGGLPGR